MQSSNRRCIVKEQEIALNNVKKQLDEIYDIVDNPSSSFIEIFGKNGRK